MATCDPKIEPFCKTWKLTKQPEDEKARTALANSWGSGCSKPASECTEIPTFRLKTSCKDVCKYYLIQRRGSNRNVIGPVTMDGKPSEIQRPGSNYHLSCDVKDKCVTLTMQDVAKKYPPTVVAHVLDSDESMTVTQNGGPLGMEIVAGFTAVENVESKEDEEL